MHLLSLKQGPIEWDIFLIHQVFFQGENKCRETPTEQSFTNVRLRSLVFQSLGVTKSDKNVFSDARLKGLVNLDPDVGLSSRSSPCNGRGTAPCRCRAERTGSCRGSIAGSCRRAGGSDPPGRSCASSLGGSVASGPQSFDPKPGQNGSLRLISKLFLFRLWNFGWHHF